MDPLTRYMIFFLACMAAIVLLTYLPDRGGKRTKATEKPSETVEQGLDPLHQIEGEQRAQLATPMIIGVWGCLMIRLRGFEHGSQGGP